jgi:hypothetical protein
MKSATRRTQPRIKAPQSDRLPHLVDDRHRAGSDAARHRSEQAVRGWYRHAAMTAGHYRDLIVRAVGDGNDDLLDSVAARLAESENALRILRAKGYGMTGIAIDAAARMVPEAFI